MVDLASIAAAATSLKTAGEIVKAMIGLRDAALIQNKVIELQGVIPPPMRAHSRPKASSLRCWAAYASLKQAWLSLKHGTQRRRAMS
jgi:hypothetical protein